MVEPRYDQFSLEGAFAAQREVVNVCQVEQGGARKEELSLWPFRRALGGTPVIGAGGYHAQSARAAIEEGLRFLFVSFHCCKGVASAESAATD